MEASYTPGSLGDKLIVVVRQADENVAVYIIFKIGQFQF